MNDEQLDDLKQFIDSRISQSESLTQKQIDNLKEEIKELRGDMNDGFAGVAEAIDEILEQNARTDERLTKLEEKTV